MNRYFLQEMGIQCWQLKAKEPPIFSGNSQLDKWEQLETEVSLCTACELYKTRTKPVFGSGNKQADLMIIGEAPGASEDQQGLPFVGRAGKLLTAMLKSIAIERDQVFITNILKSRPPNNRDPRPEEVAACTPYLLRQIELVSPRLILALGRIAAQFLLDTHTPLGKLRSTVFEYKHYQIPLVVTYHPAYLLRSPRDKAKAYDDLQLVAKLLGTACNAPR